MFSSELNILALYGLLTAGTLVLQAVGALQQLGLGYLLSARDDGHTVEGMAARTERALNNSITAMALFAPAVLALHAKGVSTGFTLAMAQAFLIARAVYLPSYMFGIKGLRSLAWSVGFLTTGALYVTVLVYL